MNNGFSDVRKEMEEMREVHNDGISKLEKAIATLRGLRQEEPLTTSSPVEDGQPTGQGTNMGDSSSRKGGPLTREKSKRMNGTRGAIFCLLYGKLIIPK